MEGIAVLCLVDFEHMTNVRQDYWECPQCKLRLFVRKVSDGVIAAKGEIECLGAKFGTR